MQRLTERSTGPEGHEGSELHERRLLCSPATVFNTKEKYVFFFDFVTICAGGPQLPVIHTQFWGITTHGGETRRVQAPRRRRDRVVYPCGLLPAPIRRLGRYGAALELNQLEDTRERERRGEKSFEFALQH
ncbi:hypothetical protein F2P81_023064 [Scophthalmus maximus]|uniref:Uncharacterized protein n=1 Tax=Scophthalmus maximus TaxID=52904 RepID=A0A6A4RYL6_SCOMX|nr:hypothetical protein F2P81_023064 [Scophthalmus maximus]